MNIQHGWNLELESKPDFDVCMQRVYAWYEGEVIDRPPVRFSRHNAEFDVNDAKNYDGSLKQRWFDKEYQVQHYIKSIQNRKFNGETFPVYWPNLGPNVYASFFGSSLTFTETTSWAQPVLDDYNDAQKFEFNTNNKYYEKIIDLTNCALEYCKGKFMVGYTDLHPGLDWVSALRGMDNTCMDLYDKPDHLKELLSRSASDFHKIYNLFNNLLKEHNQLSVTWMNIPSVGKMHIPSCDFSNFISCSQFEEFCLPVLTEETMPMTHNVFHVDGIGVARHLDMILNIPNIKAIQWAQGVGDDMPIMQWLPLIKKVLNKGKSIVLDIQKHELEDIIDALPPEGLYLCIEAQDHNEEQHILKRVLKWK